MGGNNKDLFNLNKEQFISDCIEYFLQAYNIILTVEDFKLIGLKNSGAKIYENCTVEELVSLLDNIVKKADEYFAVPINREVLAHFRNKTFLANPKYNINYIPTSVTDLIPAAQIILVRQFMKESNFVSVVKKVRKNINDYLYVTFIRENNTAENIYFSKNASIFVFNEQEITRGFFDKFNILINTDHTGKEFSKIILQEETINDDLYKIQLRKILKSIDEEFHQPVKNIEIELGLKLLNPKKEFLTTVLEVLNFRNCRKCFYGYNIEIHSDFYFVNKYKKA